METIYKVSENGDICGEIDRDIAHQHGILHSAVQCWIINDDNEILIQKRSSNKENSPNKWDVSFGGHCSIVKDNKDFLINNIIKEGNEELGITINPRNLIYLDKYRYTSQQNKNNEIINVFVTKMDKSQKFTFNDNEAVMVKWINQTDLEYGFLHQSDKFANRIQSFNILKSYLK